MERIDPDKVSPLLRAEHWHRYLWAASLAQGDVLDAACGVGYGSAALLAREGVRSYTGLDLSPDAIAHASARYADARARFLVGDVTAIPLENASVDAIVSLETIEHLEQPEKGLDEFRRVLRKDGMLLASVPSDAFERACEETYGPNEFHKSRFTLERIEDLLTERFRCVRVWECGLAISSVLSPANGTGGGEGITRVPAELEEGSSWPRSWGGAGPMGSYLLLACDDPQAVERLLAAPERRAVRLMPAVSVVEYDATSVKPLRLAHEAQANLIRDRGALLRKQDERIAEMREAMEKQAAVSAEREGRAQRLEGMVRERDAAIKGQEQLIKERVSLIKKQDELVAARDATIAGLRSTVATLQESLKKAEERDRAQAAQLKERAEALGKLEKRVAETNEVIQAQAKLVEGRDGSITRLQEMVRDRDAAIKSQTRLIDERVAYIRKLEGMVGDRDGVIEAQARLVETRDAALRERARAIEELQSAARSMEAVLGDARATLAKRRDEIASLESRIAELEETVRAVEAERADQDRRLARPVYCARLTARALLHGPSVRGARA